MSASFAPLRWHRVLVVMALVLVGCMRGPLLPDDYRIPETARVGIAVVGEDRAYHAHIGHVDGDSFVEPLAVDWQLLERARRQIARVLEQTTGLQLVDVDGQALAGLGEVYETRLNAFVLTAPAEAALSRLAAERRLDLLVLIRTERFGEPRERLGYGIQTRRALGNTQVYANSRFYAIDLERMQFVAIGGGVIAEFDTTPELQAIDRLLAGERNEIPEYNEIGNLNNIRKLPGPMLDRARKALTDALDRVVTQFLDGLLEHYL